MQVPTHRTQPSRKLREMLEHAAGYAPPPFAGTKIIVFGACASGAHARCDGTVTVGTTRYVCRCCAGHNLHDTAEYIARYEQGE